MHQRTFTKKTPYFFWVPCGRYLDITHLLQNPKLPRTSMGFNNRNLSHKTPKDGALSNTFQINIVLGHLMVCANTLPNSMTQDNMNKFVYSHHQPEKLLSDPCEARGWFTNTSVIDSLIISVKVWANIFTAPPRPNGWRWWFQS